MRQLDETGKRSIRNGNANLIRTRTQNQSGYSVRTVAGETIWQGEARLIDLPAGAAARVDIPASVLRPDDYIVELRTGPAGADRESSRYVLRVRLKP